jgi:hypothetical protein
MMASKTGAHITSIQFGEQLHELEKVNLLDLSDDKKIELMEDNSKKAPQSKTLNLYEQNSIILSTMELSPQFHKEISDLTTKAVDNLYDAINNNQSEYQSLLSKNKQIKDIKDPNGAAVALEQLDFINRLSKEITTSLGLAKNITFNIDNSNSSALSYNKVDNKYEVNIYDLFNTSDNLDTIMSSLLNIIITGEVHYGIKRGDFNAPWISNVDNAIIKHSYTAQSVSNLADGESNYLKYNDPLYKHALYTEEELLKQLYIRKISDEKTTNVQDSIFIAKKNQDLDNAIVDINKTNKVDPKVTIEIEIIMYPI